MSNDKNSLPFEKWEIELVRKKARRLTGKYGFSETDRHDLEQELLLHIFVRRSIEKYSGGSLIEHQEELSRTLDNKLRKIKEYSKRDKRSVHTRQEAIAESFEENDGTERAGWIVPESETWDEVQRATVAENPKFSPQIEEAIEALSPIQRKILQLRMDGFEFKEIARRLRRNRTTLLRQMDSVRKIFKKFSDGK